MNRSNRHLSNIDKPQSHPIFIEKTALHTKYIATQSFIYQLVEFSFLKRCFKN